MVLRIARHTNDIKKIAQFYTSLLGLSKLGSFSDHDGYDGVFIGKEGLDWHLEFTTSANPAEHKPDPDDLLVFYPKDKVEFDQLLDRLKVAGYKRENAVNPYWNKNGFYCFDPDGFAFVISDRKLR